MRIGQLLSKIRDMGIGVDKRCSIAVNMSRDLKISYFQRNSEPLFVRILERKRGEREFVNLKFLKSCLGDHIVGPTKIETTDDLACVIFPFVAYKRFPDEKLIVRNLLPQVRDVLLLMHDAGNTFNPEGRSLSPMEALDGLNSEGLLTDTFKGYFEQGFQVIVGKRKAIPQHCDFTFTNLGTAGDGTLIVFDWEDYGLVRYPAFDFATFLMSYHFHTGTIDTIINSPEELTNMIESAFGDRFLETIGFTPVEFQYVFPGYLVVFFILKKTFGSGIYERFRGIWKQMTKSEKWTRIMTERSG